MSTGRDLQSNCSLDQELTAQSCSELLQDNCALITCLQLLRSVAAWCNSSLSCRLPSSSPALLLPAASTRLTAAAAAQKNNCLQRDLLSLSQVSSVQGVRGCHNLVFTFLFSVSKRPPAFGHGLALGAGWRESTARLTVHRSNEGGGGGPWIIVEC